MKCTSVGIIEQLKQMFLVPLYVKPGSLIHGKQGNSIPLGACSIKYAESVLTDFRRGLNVC